MGFAGRTATKKVPSSRLGEAPDLSCRVQFLFTDYITPAPFHTFLPLCVFCSWLQHHHAYLISHSASVRHVAHPPDDSEPLSCRRGFEDFCISRKVLRHLWSYNTPQVPGSRDPRLLPQYPSYRAARTPLLRVLHDLTPARLTKSCLRNTNRVVSVPLTNISEHPQLTSIIL